jgi:3-oxoacyl-[acyl-carrier protein] reductase
VRKLKKFVLITGASGGIGQAIASKLAAQGYNLYLHYHQNDQAISSLLEGIRPYGGEYIPMQTDLASRNGYKQLSAEIFSLDAIIHCGGTSHYGLYTDLTEEDAVSLMNLHVYSPLMLTKELLPKFLKQGAGNIIFITSIWGQTGAACEVAYSTVKGAQIALVKALSKEVALNGVRVNGIAPGAIKTPMMSGFSEEDITIIENDIPMGRMGRPEEIAGTTAFLLSDEASYITGQILAINGGWYT